MVTQKAAVAMLFRMTKSSFMSIIFFNKFLTVLPNIEPFPHTSSMFKRSLLGVVISFS